MLSLQKQPKYIQKTLQMPNGQWALVVFELLNQEGKIVAKAVSATLIEQPITEEVLALPVLCVACVPEIIVSPFFSSIESVFKDLSFITAQSIRGPSFL